VIEIRQLSAETGHHHVPALSEVLLDCVQGGASVSFMASLSKADAECFFESVLQSLQKGERILLAAFIGAELVGTVQVFLATPPNQPHRADIAKLLVARSARGQGVASRLMLGAEETSRRAGKSLLVLDTVTGGQAERLYTRLGWTRAGVIPNYALFPDGRFCDTTIFWKQIM
jgi:GNAT superfamily N-acetyltransferase